MKLFKNNTIKYLLFISISIFSIFGCEDFLEEQPLNQIGTEFYYRNSTDALTALTAAYAKLKNNNGYYRQLFMSNLVAASDQGTSSFNHGNFRRGTISSTDPNLINPWIEIYEAIKDANNVIARVPEIEDIDADLKTRIIGEARFLRALHYFNLVRCYGEVPLRTEPVKPGEDGLPKSPVEDIYAVIIEDLQYASANCWAFNEIKNGITNQVGRVTKASAHALLAKVYIQIASSKRTAEAGILGNERYLGLPQTTNQYYQLAKEQCDLVFLQPFYQLVSSLEEWISLFDSANGNNQEMLFDIQGSNIPGQGTAVSNLFSPRQAGLSGGGFGGTNKMLPRFITFNIDKTDERYQNGIVREYEDAIRTYVLNPNSNGYLRTDKASGNTIGALFQVFTSKYIDRAATTEYTSQQNWHVIRLADVHLMHAEALAEISQNPIDAEQGLNILRQRVGMNNFDASGLTMDEFRTALLKERGAELLMEGHRFFDITRMGVYDELCKVTFGNTIGVRGPEDYTWPIPLIETSANDNID